MTSWRAPGSILEAPVVDFGRFWDAKLPQDGPKVSKFHAKYFLKLRFLGVQI